MNAQPQMFLSREAFYLELKRRERPSPNSDWLARILASWCAGEGALPDFLGLPPGEFRELLRTTFPGFYASGRAVSGRQADFSRMLERDDLAKLLRDEAGQGPEREWIIGIMVAACLGSDHLWQDLGLWSRSDLSGLMQHNFPALAGRNHRDMKWKKFLYKQLCEAEGIYVCRAPSCEVCADYARCFGPEE